MAVNSNEKQAEDYKKLSNNSQLIYGKRFLDKLDIRPSFHVLAVGCGTGNLAAYVAKSKVTEGKVSAFDPDSSRIKQAKQEFHEIKNISFDVGKTSDFIDGRTNEYDFIYSNVVLHWIPKADRLATFKSLARALKPGQIMAHQFGTPPMLKLGCRLKTALFEPEERRKFDEVGQKLLEEEEIESHAKSCGLEVISVEKFTEFSRFKNADEFMDWLNGTFNSLVPDLKERFHNYEGKIDLEEAEDGSITEETSLMAVVFKKPNF